MSVSSHSDVDRVRDATDLVRLVGEHVALTPRGREFVGLCPFHDDHKPSFAVVTHKGHAFYNCFACGASGDCFRFVMEYHKLDFPESLRMLAERAGITLSSRRDSAPGSSSDGPRRRDLLQAAVFAQTFFQQTLADPVAGAAARAVFDDRGIAPDTVELFGLGAAPRGFDGLLGRLGGKASALRTAQAGGLLKTRDDGGLYDAFRHRVMFPICDEVGRPVAFGGRIIDAEDVPKYLNSAESPIFQKSRTLYGLHLAKRTIIDSRQAIVTEGYTDVTACHQAGITNVVGTLGTALTPQHAATLTRLCDTVVLVFDGDEAGQKAADRGVEVFFSEPVDIRICVLPDGLDPDDLLRKPDGAALFSAAVEASVDALEFKLRRFETRLGDARGLSARQRHLEAFLRELAELGFGGLQGVRKRLVMTRLTDLFGVSLADLERALPRRRSRPAPGAATPSPTEAPAPATLIDLANEGPGVSRARQLAEHDVLGALLVEPDALHQVDLGPDDAALLASEGAAGSTPLAPSHFEDPAARAIAEFLLPAVVAGESPAMPQVLGALSDEHARHTAARLFREGNARASGEREPDAADPLTEALRGLARCLGRERHERETAAFLATDRATHADAVDGVLDQLRRRQQQGPVPGAIIQGVRT